MDELRALTPTGRLGYGFQSHHFFLLIDSYFIAL
ncbi:MAG: hypothetical protein ETSY2_16765 [Candidatus Entotheonella gemina]|uniref:Uncharacterized protein n=1 Tax=Candidatus Entotheonella gemina TaxID=1429439 RepID=W4MA45_9BACT|nr:MAG: hypothetical protein ETSY2_16765 [Candidatus Entotheonella gemina]